MNERMLELYGQAWVPHTAIDPSNNMPYESKIFSAEKFAELIIQECAGIAKHHVMNISTYADAEFVGEQIGKHFGVE